MSRSVIPLPKYCPSLVWFSLVLLLPTLFFIAGCGGKGSKNSVSGKVSLKGEPVSGSVTFIGADGKQATGPISPDGTYSVSDPPLGDDKIVIKGMPGMINTPAPKPSAELMKNMPPSKPMPVSPPAKYANPTNGLTFKVTGGKQTFDIELKP